jgi:hypothetical protein
LTFPSASRTTKSGFTFSTSSAIDAGDKRTGLRPLRADADPVRIARNASVGNVDIVIARGEILTGRIAHCDVVAAGCVEAKRSKTGGRVVAACCVVTKCGTTVGCVVRRGCVARKRAKTIGYVAGPRCVAKERINTARRVVGGSVVLKRSKTGGRVGVSVSEVEQCVCTVGRVSGAGGEARERPAPFCGVAVLQV